MYHHNTINSVIIVAYIAHITQYLGMVYRFIMMLIMAHKIITMDLLVCSHEPVICVHR